MSSSTAQESTPDQQQQPEIQSRRDSITMTPELLNQCLKQVEFYFSESNFPYDKFLKRVTAKNDGWVPISTIMTFNRMKKYRPVDKVIEHLRTSTILEVSEDGENIKRKEPLDLNKFNSKDARVDQSKRTLAILNFPHGQKEEETKFTELQEQIEVFFAKLSSANQVRLRKDHKKHFNGTVLVEFHTEKHCNEFAENYAGDEPKELLSFGGNKLNVLTKKQYDLQKFATKSKNFSGSGQRSRSFTGHRKNMPVLKKDSEENTENKSTEEKKDQVKESDASAIADDDE